MSDRDAWGSVQRPQPLYRRRWVQAGVAALLASTGLGINASSHTSSRDRTADLRSYYDLVTGDLRSCAGGLHDALTAMQAVISRADRDVITATQIVSDGQQACTPVVDTKLYDLATSQPPPTLARLGLQSATENLSRWAYPQAATALGEVHTIVRGRNAPENAAAFRRLQQGLAGMRVTAAQAQQVFFAAAAELHTTLPALPLDGQAQLPGTQQP